MSEKNRIKTVAIIGAGASGAITAAAFKAEKYFDRIQVFERRESAGGTWIYDPSPSTLPIRPGRLPPALDPPLSIPNELPKVTSPNEQERFSKTPIYSSLTTNVPAIAMSYSDIPFPYGPFVPHHIPKQYIETYLSHHEVDTLVNFNTTVENISLSKTTSTTFREEKENWTLTLRKHDPLLNVDKWWEDKFDAVVLANGHYTVPYIPKVEGLEEYIELFPGRVVHSKTYRTPLLYKNKKILIIGNSASGHDLTADLVPHATKPIYQSRRSVARWDGPKPPEGVVWKSIIKEYLPNGTIVFDDGTKLEKDELDTVVYCTGYLPSFPFWNAKENGREIWDYNKNKLSKIYLHTFFHDFKTLGIVGMPKVLTFRSFEYQAIALARLYSGRSLRGLPDVEAMERWEQQREEQKMKDGRKFHDIEWETGETLGWLGELYQIAGLGLLTGEGRVPPVISQEIRRAIENVRKYPEPGKGKGEEIDREMDSRGKQGSKGRKGGWVVLKKGEEKDLLSFI